MRRETKRLLLCWGKVACKLLNLGAFTPGKTARLQFEAFTFCKKKSIMLCVMHAIICLIFSFSF